MRRLLAALLLALTALLVLAPAPPAAAHATLIVTDPAEGSPLQGPSQRASRSGSVTADQTSAASVA